MDTPTRPADIGDKPASALGDEKSEARAARGERTPRASASSGDKSEPLNDGANAADKHNVDVCSKDSEQSHSTLQELCEDRGGRVLEAATCLSVECAEEQTGRGGREGSTVGGRGGSATLGGATASVT